MTDIAIKVENLGKRYRMGQYVGSGAQYKTLRQSLANAVSAPLRRLRRNPQSAIRNPQSNDPPSPIPGPSSTDRFIWALRDVSFEVKHGEVLGIIGRNGAGKSTLLKILTRITEPSEGRAVLSGRVNSLLEVGTGFHPELTGRENVRLSGAILGMTRKEIDRKFDEIVDFSGVEAYIDTPVKRYSSGMRVRLGFAVAAHLEPEILLIDEVLAVGDAQFQKKCLGKMGNVAKEGRTVLFVSHNIRAVKQLCSKGILLEGGVKKIEGEITAVTDQYMNCEASQNLFAPFKIKEIDVMVTKIAINEESRGLVTPFKPLKIDIELDAEHDIDTIGFEIMISNDDTAGVLFRTNTYTIKNIHVKIKKGKNIVSCIIKSLNLSSGRYWLGFGVSLLMVKYYYYELALLNFDVSEVLIEQGPLPTASAYSHIYLTHDWVIQN